MTSTPTADRVRLADPQAAGLDAMLAALLRNEVTKPAKAALLDAMHGTVTLTVPDQGAEAGLIFAAGAVTVLGSGIPRATLHLVLDSATMVGLASLPTVLRVLPNPLAAEVRDLARKVLTRRVRVGGAWHVGLLKQVTALLKI